MFVNIIQFPAILLDKDAEFLEWFNWTNREYAKFDGFISRRLLKPRDEGNYFAIVEHDSFESFMAMHTSPFQAEAHKKVEALLDGDPDPLFFDVVI